MWEEDEERLKVVRHKPIGHLGSSPNHVFVNRDFSLWYHWDDQEAAFVLTMSNFKCNSFFQSGSGPWVHEQ